MVFKTRKPSHSFSIFKTNRPNNISDRVYKMKFCPTCRNMLYGIDEDAVEGKKTAVMVCRKCSYREPLGDANPIVYEHILREDKTASLTMNPYLKHDPTLEHLANIVCPNADCPSRVGSANPDVVPVKLSEKHLVWMYQCVNCDETWKQNSGLHK
jgi:DNA-directed RNA polymerase subunit M/transcription elongation factor TFIIS